MEHLTSQENNALARLISIAERHDAIGARISHFLLSWSDATIEDGFNFADAWRLPSPVRNDLICVFGAVMRVRSHASTSGYASGSEWDLTSIGRALQSPVSAV